MIEEQQLLVKQYRTEATMTKLLKKLSKKMGADKILADKFEGSRRVYEASSKQR